MARPFSNDLARTWNRHCPKCVSHTAYMIGNHAFRTDTQKVCLKCRGSQHTREARLHALWTTLALTRIPLVLDSGENIRVDDYRADMGNAYLTSPLSGRVVSISECETDRVNAGGDYIPGNIAMIPGDENELRHLAEFDENAYSLATQKANAIIVASRGILRGPNAWKGQTDLIALIKGQSNGKNDEMTDTVISSIESGRFAV